MCHTTNATDAAWPELAVHPVRGLEVGAAPALDLQSDDGALVLGRGWQTCNYSAAAPIDMPYHSVALERRSRDWYGRRTISARRHQLGRVVHLADWRPMDQDLLERFQYVSMESLSFH